MKQSISQLVLAIALIDLLGFIFWTLSGQTPMDSFYIGKLTALFISIFN